VSAILEWAVPFSIQSSKGTLTLNDEANPSGLFLVLQEGCEATRRLRVVTDDIPQADGQINHQRFTAGYEIQLLVALWKDRSEPACDQQAREMGEELMLHLNCMLNDTGRLFWTPTGLGDQRLLDEARTRECGAFTFGPSGVGDARLQFRFDSPFPYVYDFTQLTVSLEASTPQNITNQGNVDFWPVVKVYGPTTAFSIENETISQAIVYDSSLPGAVDIGVGEYMEFDFFRNTAYLNGTGASGKPGIDMTLSDFWPLQAGVANSIEISGADGDVLYNHAYA